jgi:hypothetical protein
MSRLTPGQPLAGNLKATEFNRHVDVAEWYHRNKALGDPSRTFASDIPTDIVKVKNVTGGDLVRGNVVEIGTRPIDALDPEHLWFRGETPDLSRPFGILRVPIPANKYGECQLAGACIARVSVTSTVHRHARLESGSTTLVSSGAGPVSLLEPPISLGTQDLAVRVFEEPRIEIVKKTSNERNPVSGYFPGKLMRFDPLLHSLVEVADIWLEDMNQV